MGPCKICNSKLHASQADDELFCGMCKGKLLYIMADTPSAHVDKPMAFTESDMINFCQKMFDDSSMKHKVVVDSGDVQYWMKQRPAEKPFGSDIESGGFEKMKDDLNKAYLNAMFPPRKPQPMMNAAAVVEAVDRVASPKFKVGDWVWHEISKRAMLVVKETTNDYEIQEAGCNAMGFCIKKLANNNEVYLALITEANRRGYKKGTKIRWSGDEQKYRSSLSGSFEYNPARPFDQGSNLSDFSSRDVIWIGKTNEWAEIVSSESAQFGHYLCTMTHPTHKDLRFDIQLEEGYNFMSVNTDFYNEFNALLSRYIK